MNPSLRPVLLSRTAVFVLALTGVLLAPVFAQEEEANQVPIRVDVNLLTLRFTVRDLGGVYVNSLEQDDFRVLENGLPQDIAFFDPPRNPRAGTRRLWLGFLLDVSGSTFATRAEEIVAAQTFLDNITTITHIGVYGFTDSLIPFQRFTPNRELALRAFQEARKHLGRTAIYDSLMTLMSEIDSLAQPQDDKAVIVLSDGIDDAYRKSQETTTRARQSGIRLYTILVPSAAQIYIGPTSSREAAGNSAEAADNTEDLAKRKAFARLSEQTRGRHFSGFETILDFDDTLAQINDDLFGNLYTIAYYTDNPSIPIRNRNIDIRPGSSSYAVSLPFKKLPQQQAAKRELIVALFNNSAFGVDRDTPRFREIGAEMDVLSPRREGDQMGFPFRIKISPYSFQGALSNGVNTHLGVIGRLINSNGEEVVRLREVFRVSLGAKQIRDGQGIVYTNRLLAAPGSYQLQIALLELGTWRLTSFRQAVRISEPN